MKWDGKKKALTFSFDDGVTQDVRLIELLNKYNLKGTFNLNSSLLGLKDMITSEVTHYKVKAKDVRSIYDGHEVAVHTLTHPLLPSLDDDTICYQVERDRQTLSELCGYEVVGMAYPCGGQNNDDRVASVIKQRTGVRYARTIESNGNFNLQKNLYRFNPSAYFIEIEKMLSLAEMFLNGNDEEYQLFYIWGHSYELDIEPNGWQNFEEFCKLVSSRPNVFYCTNREALL